MKRIFLLLVCVVYASACLAQKIELSNVATVAPQNKITKLSSDQVYTFLGSKFKNGHGPILTNLMKHESDSGFKINGFLISLKIASAKGQYLPDYLQNEKAGLDGLSQAIKGYSSRVETVNGLDVLIALTPATDGMSYYYFYTIDKPRRHRIAGTMPFNNSDSAKAKETLYEVLSNITFK